MTACRKACDLSNYYANTLLQLVNDPSTSFCPQSCLFTAGDALIPSLLTSTQLHALIQLTDIPTVYSYCERLIEVLEQCIRGAHVQMNVLADQGILDMDVVLPANSPAVTSIEAIWAQVQNAGVVEYVIAVLEDNIKQIVQTHNWMVMPSLWEVEKELRSKGSLTEQEQACLKELQSVFISSPDHGSALDFEPCRFCIDSMTTLVRQRSMDMDKWFVEVEEWIKYLYLAFQTNV